MLHVNGEVRILCPLACLRTSGSGPISQVFSVMVWDKAWRLCQNHWVGMTSWAGVGCNGGACGMQWQGMWDATGEACGM